MSIARIPFIIGAIFGPYVTYTPPTSMPLPQEKDRISHEEGLLRPSHIAPYIKALYLLLGAVETIVVVADNTRWLPASNHIMKLLMNGGTEHLCVTKLSALGAFLVMLGGLIRLDCYRAMGRHFTFDLSIRDSHKLVTEGLYGVVQHPGYSGALLNAIGLFCFYFSRGSWLRESGVSRLLVGKVLIGMMVAFGVGPLATFWERMRLEDEALKTEFGEAWNKWAKEVRWWLVPGVY